MLTDIDEKFAEMIKDMHELYSLQIKAGMQVNFGGIGEINYKYMNLGPEDIKKLIKKKERQAIDK